MPNINQKKLYYTERGHSSGKYVVEIKDSDGNSKELKFNENDYYFLMTEQPPQKTKQQGGKRKSIKQKNHKKKTLKNQLKRNNRNNRNNSTRYSIKLY